MSEIKTSFSWRYLAILILGTLIGVGGNIVYSIYTENQNKQSLTITSISDTNKIKKVVDSNILDIKYSLFNDSTEIKSFFENTIVVTNNSNRGVENIVLSIRSDNDDISLIKTPKISTNPKEIKSSLNIDYKSISNHEIIIPLLNKEETVILNYEAFSLKEIENFNLSATVRKKDVYIEYNDELDFNKAHVNDDLYVKKIFFISTAGFLLIIMLLFYIFLNTKYKLDLLQKIELEKFGKERDTIKEDIKNTRDSTFDKLDKIIKQIQNNKG